MTEDECKELHKANETDEWKYQDFCVSGVIGLIGASWVLKGEAIFKGVGYKPLLWSILIAILFLCLRGIRQSLNIIHNRKILEEEADAEDNNRPPPYTDAAPDKTKYGRLSQHLFDYEIGLMIISLILFLANAFAILI